MIAHRSLADWRARLRRASFLKQRVLLGGGDRLPGLAVFLDGGHVERAERAENRALVLRRLDGDQLIEERRDLRGGRSGDDGFGEHFERLQLVRVEELGFVGRRGSLLLRLLDAGGAGQVVLHRVLRLDDRRQRQARADAAQQRLQHRAARDAVVRRARRPA